MLQMRSSSRARSPRRTPSSKRRVAAGSPCGPAPRRSRPWRRATARPRVVACGDDPGARAALSGAGIDEVTYGTGESSAVRLDVRSPGPRGALGVVSIVGQEDVEVRLQVDGAHNLLNATAAIATTHLLG